MANTTNFGWETPDDTDLVKDGAAAMRTLGNAIDTSLVDLKGGTTGQVLSKNTNTDMDFTWVTPQVGDITEVAAGVGISGGGTSGSVTITNSMATAIDAKGDLIVGTGADTFSRLAVGATNGHTLQVDSTTATGLKWAANPGSSYTWTSYTPTYNNFTLGNGSQTFGYLQIDKIVFVRGKLNLGSTSTVTGQIEISVPVSEGMEDFITTFQVSYYDNSAAIQYSGAGRIFAGFINLLAFKSDATYLTEPGTSGTVPIPFGSGDVIIVGGWYQAS